MKRLIGIVLIVLSIAMGVLGIQKLQNSGGSVEIAGLELSAQDKSAKTQGFVYLGLGLVLLPVGGSIVRKSNA